MSFEIGEPIEEGFDRLTERNGLLFVGLFVAIGLISSVFAADFVSTLIADAIESGDIDPADIDTSNNPLLGDDPTEPLFGLPIAVSLVGMAASLLAHASVAIAAARTFVGEETDRIPREHFTRKLGWSLLNLVVGGILFGIAVGIGFVFLIVPGFFLLVSLYFWPFAVVVDDESFVGGFARSWTLTSGNRIALFVLGLIVVLVTGVVSSIGTAVSAPLPPIAGVLVSGVFSGATFVFTVAVAARAYRQLQRERPTETDAEFESDSGTVF